MWMNWAGNGCGWGWGPGHFFGWPLGMLIGILFWALVIYGIYYLVSRLGKSPAQPPKEKTPLEIARERYAKGELSAEEYARLKKDLEP